MILSDIKKPTKQIIQDGKNVRERGERGRLKERREGQEERKRPMR